MGSVESARTRVIESGIELGLAALASSESFFGAFHATNGDSSGGKGFERLARSGVMEMEMGRFGQAHSRHG